MQPALRVVVADATPLGAALAAALASDRAIECVARVVDPVQLIADARRLRPDVVLLGRLGGGAALQALGEVVGKLPDVKVLVLSEVSSDILAHESLRRGAIGFLVHSGDVGTLLPRIRACIGQPAADVAGTALA